MTDTTAPETGSTPAPLTDRYGVPVDATKGDQFSSCLLYTSDAADE